MTGKELERRPDETPEKLPEHADVELLDWRGGESGVQMAEIGDRVAVRNGNDPLEILPSFTRSEVRAFLQGAKAGEFDDLGDEEFPTLEAQPPDSNQTDS